MELVVSRRDRESMVESINSQPIKFINTNEEREGYETYAKVLKRCFQSQFSVRESNGNVKDLEAWSRKSPKTTKREGIIRFSFVCRNCQGAIKMSTSETSYRSTGSTRFSFTHQGCQVLRKPNVHEEEEIQHTVQARPQEADVQELQPDARAAEAPQMIDAREEEIINLDTTSEEEEEIAQAIHPEPILIQDQAERISNKLCYVCYDNLFSATVAALDPCGHTFHLECVEQSIRINRRSCPVCNGALNKVIKLFLL